MEIGDFVRYLCQIGIPFVTTSLAILELRALGFERLHLELPYPQWLIDQASLY